MAITLYRNNDLFPTLREFDHFFDRFFGNDMVRQSAPAAGFAPVLDLYVEEDGFLVTAELPGVKPEDIELSVEKDILTLAGEKKCEFKDEKNKCYRAETRYGKFSRKIRLPENIDAEKIKASFDNGVLKIRLEKAEQAKPKTIAIETN